MNRGRFKFLICAAVLSIAVLSVGQQLSQYDVDLRDATTMQKDYKMMKLHVGKTGDLTIKEPAGIDSVTLQPGKYKVKHFDSPIGHYVDFELLTRQTGGRFVRYERHRVASVDCELKSLNAKVKHTELMESADHKIIGLEIRGENVEHVF